MYLREFAIQEPAKLSLHCLVSHFPAILYCGWQMAAYAACRKHLPSARPRHNRDLGSTSNSRTVPHICCPSEHQQHRHGAVKAEQLAVLSLDKHNLQLCPVLQNSVLPVRCMNLVNKLKVGSSLLTRPKPQTFLAVLFPGLPCTPIPERSLRSGRLSSTKASSLLSSRPCPHLPTSAVLQQYSDFSKCQAWKLQRQLNTTTCETGHKPTS